MEENLEVYRPTVRMDPAFRAYVDSVYAATRGLDRNMILRLMLFAAPFSPIVRGEIHDRLKSVDVTPSPPWNRADTGLWMNQTWSDRSERADVGDIKISVGGNL